MAHRTMGSAFGFRERGKRRKLYQETPLRMPGTKRKIRQLPIRHGREDLTVPHVGTIAPWLTQPDWADLHVQVLRLETVARYDDG